MIYSYHYDEDPSIIISKFSLRTCASIIVISTADNIRKNKEKTHSDILVFNHLAAMVFH